MRAEKIWPWAIGGVLALTVALNIFVIHLADEDNAAVVEPDYYHKAVMWDSTRAVADRSAALGWTVTHTASAVGTDGAAQVTVHAVDRDGRAVAGARGHITAISNLEAARPVAAAFVAGAAPGDYVATLPLHHGGLWEFRVDLTSGRDYFVTSLRADVGGPAPRRADGGHDPAARRSHRS